VGVVAEPPTSRMIQPRSGQDTLPAHLEDRYGIQASGLTELDLGVYRVGRRDGPDWVARVFAADRPIAAAEGDAALLRRLEQDGFPAERCAAQEPVSAHEGQGVLVTRYLEGTGADGSRRTYSRLGSLLGRLPTGMAPLALLLFARGNGRSIALALIAGGRSLEGQRLFATTPTGFAEVRVNNSMFSDRTGGSAHA